MFELVFVRGGDPAAPRVVEQAVAELGGDAGAFREYAAREGRAELAELQRELAAAGLFSVPAYLTGGEVFLGRQHLPMLEWLLTGRTGLAPI
jgi:2-hydroxychromene-2-carboxylate isomerase